MITIGDSKAGSFQEPLALMEDCHRRIERFLGILLLIVNAARDEPLSVEHREGMERSLRYFRSAAPLHTQDEEASLFPRMRACSHPDVRAAMKDLSSLESDHRRAELAHAEVDSLGQMWLDTGSLSTEGRERMALLLEDLQRSYRRHIDLEDSCVYPLAGRALDADSIQAVGREMAHRRGVDFHAPADGSRCVRGREPTQARDAAGQRREI